MVKKGVIMHISEESSRNQGPIFFTIIIHSDFAAVNLVLGVTNGISLALPRELHSKAYS